MTSLLLASTLLLASEPRAPAVLSRVLVYPRNPATPVLNPRPEDFDARIDGKPLRIVSVAPASAETGSRPLVVLDLASMPPSAAACVVPLVRNAWIAPDGLPAFELRVVVSGVLADKVWEAGRERYVFLPPGSAGSTPAGCPPLTKADSRWRGSFWEGRSLTGFAGLIDELARRRGPATVIWIGYGFSWYQDDVGLAKLEQMSRAGVSFFPLVLNGLGESVAFENSQSRIAGRLAALSGGEALRAAPDPSLAITSIAECAAKALVVNLEFPPVAGKRRPSGRTLTIRPRASHESYGLSRLFAMESETDDPMNWIGIWSPPARAVSLVNQLPVRILSAPSSLTDLSYEVEVAVPRRVAESSRLILAVGLEPSPRFGAQTQLILREPIGSTPPRSIGSNAAWIRYKLSFGSPSARHRFLLYSEAAAWLGVVDLADAR